MLQMLLLPVTCWASVEGRAEPSSCPWILGIGEGVAEEPAHGRNGRLETDCLTMQVLLQYQTRVPPFSWAPACVMTETATNSVRGQL